MNDLLSVKDKVILLTGAAGYLGSAMGVYLQEQGATVIGMSRSEKVRDLFKHTIVCDLNHEVIAMNYLNEILWSHPVDVLINNAYDLSSETGFARNLPLNRVRWQHSFDSMYWTIWLTDFIGKHMREYHGGSIINISSMYSKIAPDPKLYDDTQYWNPESYSVMKAGINAYTKRTAVKLGPDNIRCNAVLPGAFPNKSVDDQVFLQRLRDKSVLGRVGKPEELCGIVQYLASDASSFTTGQEFIIDGGWTCV